LVARTRLLLIRHGESWHKQEGVTGGPRSCRGLTEEGRQQALRLRDRLARDGSLTGRVHLYSSVVPRAVETAHLLSEAFGEESRTVRQDCGLCSWHLPAEADGMQTETFQREQAAPGGGLFRPFETGNETWAELVARVGRSLMSIAQRHFGETTLVVTHAEPVNASFIVFGQIPLMPGFEVTVSNVSLTEWTTADDPAAWPPARWTLVRFNDAAHLAPW
jgi:2,3-bisphosphoglycerate-dependent phosphoglycerate mutase